MDEDSIAAMVRVYCPHPDRTLFKWALDGKMVMSCNQCDPRVVLANHTHEAEPSVEVFDPDEEVFAPMNEEPRTTDAPREDDLRSDARLNIALAIAQLRLAEEAAEERRGDLRKCMREASKACIPWGQIAHITGRKSPQAAFAYAMHNQPKKEDA